MWILLLTISALFLAAGLWLALQAAAGHRRSGLPRGRLVYADTGRWSEVARPYFSRRYRLTGKPDYLVETKKGLVPVEVKRSSAPPDGRVYDSHLMQLAAYCLLLEEVHGQRPPYGLIHYANGTMRVDYTPTLRRELLHLLDQMREDRCRVDVARSHESAARCQACGVRHACGREALEW